MASPPKAPAADPIDARLVRRLADILTETGLSEIEVEHSGLKIRVAKTLTAAPMQMMQAAPMSAAPAPVAAAASATGSAPELLWVGVAPEHRRRGIATLLVAALAGVPLTAHLGIAERDVVDPLPAVDRLAIVDHLLGRHGISRAK